MEEIKTEEQVEKVETEQVVEEITATESKAEKKASKKEKKQQPVESYEGLSDEEIYTKMQTEKLVQRKKKRKIITAVAMGVAFALALIIIIMATVPVSLKPECVDNNYQEVRLYPGTNKDNPATTILKSDSRYKKFKKVFDDSFAQSYLSALFSGSLSTYEIEENHQSLNGAMDELTRENSYYIGLTYAKERKVTKKNGKVYSSNRYANRNWTFSFNQVYIAVNREAGFQNTRVYIPVVYPSSDTDLYAIVITVKSDTNKIYKAWKDFVQE